MVVPTHPVADDHDFHPVHPVEVPQAVGQSTDPVGAPPAEQRFETPLPLMGVVGVENDVLKLVLDSVQFLNHVVIPVVEADEEEYTERLAAKLGEEVAEYRESRELDELADILEVVHAIRKNEGITSEELQELREEKAEQRGRFDERIVLERVEE